MPGVSTPDKGCTEECCQEGGVGAQGRRHPPTVILRWMSASPTVTVEELRPTGCTAIVRGNRKKTMREEVTRQMNTARNTESFLWENRTRGRGVEKSGHQGCLGRGRSDTLLST